MSDEAHTAEQCFLAEAYLDPGLIDQAVADGLTAGDFTHSFISNQWAILVELRCEGKPADLSGVVARATETGRLAACGGYSGLVDISRIASGPSLSGASYLAAVLSAATRRKAWKLCNRATTLIEGGTEGLEKVAKIAEELAGVCTGSRVPPRDVATVAAEAEAEAEAAISGTPDERVTVVTGFPEFDRRATPIYPHEYVVVGGRSSHGKSSFLNQVVGNNLARGLKVAIFTLETSDKSVVKQLAGQRAGVNLRELASEPKERQERYLHGLKYLAASKNLQIFDRDLTLDAINARCRMLAQTFKPNLVVLDYLGLAQGAGDSLYERTAAASKAMIPLQKLLGCVLMAGAQLNQESEKDKREPGRTDFRDAGTLLDDAHRIIQVWRKPDQFVDQQYYACELLQVKLRDGPLVKLPVRFHAATTKFFEEAAV